MRVIDADRTEAALGWSVLAKAAAVAERLAAIGLPTCGRRQHVTASTAPLVRGAWLQEGTHLDLFGAFKEDMRGSDDAAIAGDPLIVDGREGALKAGDLAQPIAAAVIAADRIAADLFELCRGSHPGRRHKTERTIFQVVGLVPEDLTATRLALATEAGGA